MELERFVTPLSATSTDLRSPPLFLLWQLNLKSWGTERLGNETGLVVLIGVDNCGNLHGARSNPSILKKGWICDFDIKHLIVFGYVI